MIKKRESTQIINDPELKPFYITKDEYSYAVKQMVEPDKTHFRTKSNKTYEKIIGYFVSPEYAILKIFKLKKDLNDHSSLESYINECKTINKQFEEYATKFRSNL